MSRIPMKEFNPNRDKAGTSGLAYYFPVSISLPVGIEELLIAGS